MFARTQAHEHATRQCHMVGIWGSILANVIAAAVVTAQAGPSEEILILLVFGVVTVIVNVIGDDAAKISGVIWAAPTAISGFMIFRNLGATASSVLFGSIAGAGDPANIATFFVFAFIGSGLNMLFAFLAAR